MIGRAILTLLVGARPVTVVWMDPRARQSLAVADLAQRLPERSALSPRVAYAQPRKTGIVRESVPG